MTYLTNLYLENVHVTYSLVLADGHLADRTSSKNTVNKSKPQWSIFMLSG